MSTDHTKKIESLFHTALELEPAMRHTFLAEACAGDPVLRSEVESLLAAHVEVPEFLDRPAWSMLTDHGAPSKESRHEPEAGLPFEKLGEFRLLRKLGEGGMGVVYLAEQESLGREVALKVIRPERVGSMEAEARFLREADAISELRHPHIVTVYGSGEEKGVRYFAMELLEGKRLDEILRTSTEIDTPRILEWIRDLADALACAHKAGILHRDVKPSNIVITPEGRAMLMDFGVARNLNLSTLTLTGEFRGTPNYASPEQVKARRQKIDGRTDIYSLGVTLYEAVTGNVPFKGETTEQVFHKILEEEPVPPHRINPAVSRDLETVILAAMEKEPKRRYPTMGDFAGDVDHLLKSEMIMAQPPGLPTKVLKRVRRHPVASSAAAVALLSGLCFVLYVALISYPQIVKEREAALVAKAEAEREAAKAMAINRFLQNMLYAPDPGEEGKDIKVSEVLDKASAGLKTEFEGQPEIKAALHDTLGKTYLTLGLHDKAEPHTTASLNMHRNLYGNEHRDTLAAMNGMANVLRRQGRFEEAEALYRKSLEISRRILGEKNEHTITFLHNLGLVLSDQGRITEAEPLQRQAIELRKQTLGEEHPETLMSMNNLATNLWKQDRFEEAEALYSEVIRIKRRVLGDEHPSTLVSINNLALALKKQGRFEEAEALIREVLDVEMRILGDEHPVMLATMYNLANVAWKLGELEEAEALHRKAYALRRKVLPEDHQDLLNSMNYLAIVCMDVDKGEEAQSLFHEALRISKRKHGKQHPYTVMTLGNLFCAFFNDEKFAEAEPPLRELLAIQRRTLGEDHDKTLETEQNLAEVLMKHGELLLRGGQYEEAEGRLLESYEINRTSKVSALLVELYETTNQPEKAAEYRTP